MQNKLHTMNWSEYLLNKATKTLEKENLNDRAGVG